MFNQLRLAIACVALFQVDVGNAQDFIFQRTAMRMEASGEVVTDINVDFVEDDRDTQVNTNGSANIVIGAESNNLGDEVAISAIGQADVNPDSQPILQSMSVTNAIGLADVSHPDNTWAAGWCYVSAKADVTADLVQLSGSGGSVDAEFELNVTAEATTLPSAPFGVALDSANLYARLFINGIIILTIDTDSSGDVWLTDVSGSAVVGNVNDGTVYYLSPSFTLIDGDTVKIESNAVSRFSGSGGTPALDSVIVHCDVSALVRVIP